MDAWSRQKLGWATVTNVTINTLGVTIPPVPNSSVIYRLWTNGNGGQQYFLLENRVATGFDETLPDKASGLLIYHVDEAVGDNDNNNEWYYAPGPGNDRSNKGHYKVALEQADGNFSLERTKTNSSGIGPNQGDRGDVWRKGQSFDSTTLPSSRKYNAAGTRGEGDPSYVQVRDISDPAADRSITADLHVSSNEFAATTITLPAAPAGDEIPVYQTMTQFEGTAFDDDPWGTGVWEVQV
jgi:immune inhibitor A